MTPPHSKSDQRSIGSARFVAPIVCVLAAVLLVLAARIAFVNLGQYSDNYDEGVYLESARLMDHGYPLYRGIFDSQPPLWLVLVDTGFRLFGESVRSGRLVTSAGFVLTVAALIAAGWQLRGPLAGLLAGGLVLLSPYYLGFARVVEAEVPSAALAAVGVACAARYANGGRRRWLVLASLGVSAGTLVKLLGIYAFPALGLSILAHWWQRPARRTERVVHVLADAGIAFGIFVASCAVFMLALGPRLVWDQAVTFHIVARTAYHPVSTAQNFATLVGFLQHEPILSLGPEQAAKQLSVLAGVAKLRPSALLGAPLAALCLLGGWRGLAALAWVLFTGAGLVGQQPLFDHQAATVLPPLALAIAVGWAQFLELSQALIRRTLQKPLPLRALALAGATLLVVPAVLALVGFAGQVWPAWAAESRLGHSTPAYREDILLARIVDAHTRPRDVILTDQQTIAFWANRLAPPGLTDTSFVRIASGYLAGPQVISQSEEYHVTMVVLASGRLRQLPDVVTWAVRSFNHQIDLGHGRVVYWK